MNDIAGFHHYHETKQISHGDRTDAQICAQLEDALQLAESGEWLAARTICAEVMMVHQPRLARDPRLLAAMLAALVVARGFRAAARLLAAVGNRTVRFQLVSQRAASLAACRHDLDGVDHVTISEPWLDDPVSVRAWSEQLGRDLVAHERVADDRPGHCGAWSGRAPALSP